MIAVQKLMRNGTSTVVTIPRPVLMHCDLMAGQVVVWEVLEDKTLRLRPCTDAALSPRKPPKMILTPDAEVTR